MIVVERFFYAVTSAYCSGMFIVFGSPLAAIRGQGHSVSRGPKPCALRSDRRMALALEPISSDSPAATGPSPNLCEIGKLFPAYCLPESHRIELTDTMVETELTTGPAEPLPGEL